MQKDFYPDEIARELNKIDVIRNTFNQYYRNDWIHLNHQEDFQEVYLLDKTIRFKIENIYPEGQSISHDIRFDLEYNDIKRYPTITDFINNFRNKYINDIKNIKKVSQDIQNIVNLNNINIWAVNAMIKLYNQQVELLENIESILKIIEKTDYFKKENPSMFEKIKQHKVVYFFTIIVIILFSGIGYLISGSQAYDIIKNFSKNEYDLNIELVDINKNIHVNSVTNRKKPYVSSVGSWYKFRLTNIGKNSYSLINVLNFRT